MRSGTSLLGVRSAEPVRSAEDLAADGGLVTPSYDRAGIAALLPALAEGLAGRGWADWLPGELNGSTGVVVVVVDGLGWLQLRSEAAWAPLLASAPGMAITSVVPSTTASALTSITTGAAPGIHGIVGYRIRLGTLGVLNVLGWYTGSYAERRDASRLVPPEQLQPLEPFAAANGSGLGAVPVVSRADLVGTPFSDAHLRGARQLPWRQPSTIVFQVRRLLEAGSRFVYAYYEGVDKVAHEWGLGDAYRHELRFADRLVADLVDVLPAGVSLVVTADHGQVEVPGEPIVIGADLAPLVEGSSGEGRFRWLHARPGAAAELRSALAERFADLAWVRSAEEVVDAGWLGPASTVSKGALERLGDVALAAREAVAFYDPSDGGPTRLVTRHGSLSAAEMLVPLLVLRRA